MSIRLAAVVLAWILAPGLSICEGNRRIVAVGDVHGALDAFREILLETELVDGEGNWSGEDAILVQTGDFLDRGTDSIEVARWLMELQRQAPESGGRVVVLLGNHEAMNLMGDLRFVPPEMLEPMVGKDSEKRRDAMCKQRVAILRRGAKILGQKPPPKTAAREVCVAGHPPGLVEYQAALRPGAPLGDWLRSLPAIVRIGETVFVHGGISPEIEGELAEKAKTEENAEVEEEKNVLEAIGVRVHEELELLETWRRFLVEEGYMLEAATLPEMSRAVSVAIAEREAQSAADPGDSATAPSLKGSGLEEPGLEEPDLEEPGLEDYFEMKESYMLSPEGPLWFRGYHSWSAEEGLTEMPEILETLGARRIVVGHTPQKPPRIRCRFGGRVFLIDTGMLEEYYEGVPSALEIRGEKVEAIYVGERVERPCAPPDPS